MRRREFMVAMERELSVRGRSADEIRDILADFEEHITSGVDGGRAEEDVIAALGEPGELAAAYEDGAEGPGAPEGTPPPAAGTGTGGAASAGPAVAPAKGTVTAGGVGRGVLAALGLLFFDLIVALPILGSLFAVVVALWAVPLSIAVAGGALVVASFVPVSFLSIPFSGVYVPSLVLAFAGIALLALSVLFGIGMYHLSRLFVLGVKAFAIAHARIVKGGSRS
jgi:uncharacterized membrane protein